MQADAFFHCQISAWEKSYDEDKNTTEDNQDLDIETSTEDQLDGDNCKQSTIRRLSTAELLKSIRRRFKRFAKLVEHFL